MALLATIAMRAVGSIGPFALCTHLLVLVDSPLGCRCCCLLALLNCHCPLSLFVSPLCMREGGGGESTVASGGATTAIRSPVRLGLLSRPVLMPFHALLVFFLFSFSTVLSALALATVAVDGVSLLLSR